MQFISSVTMVSSILLTYNNYYTCRNPEFDRKCIPGGGCWYCCRRCDVCMLDSTAGLKFSTQSEEVTRAFHDEKCKDFSFCSHEFPSSVLWEEPLKDVTFHLIPTYNDGKLSGEVTGKHLLSITLSSYNEINQCPTRTAVDIYKIKEGNNLIPCGCCIALFDVRTSNTQTFGEFFLTNELILQEPLPHVRAIVDKVQVQHVNEVIHEVILKSGHDVKYVHSLCDTETDYEPLQTRREDSDCNELIGLDV